MSDIILNFRAQGLEEMAGSVEKASKEMLELVNAEGKVLAQGNTLKSLLRDTRNELEKLALAGKQNTDEYKKLRDEAGRLADTIADVNQELRQAGSDTKGLDIALRAVTSLTAGFQVAQGAAALFGDESEDLQKALLKVNALMSVTNGLQQIHAEYMREDSIFTQVATRAKELYSRAVASAGVSTKTFNAILGVGLVGALIAIATNYKEIVGWISKVVFGHDQLSKSAKILAQAEREASDAIADEVGNMNLLLAVARDENRSKEERLSAIAEINRNYPEYLGNLTLENINTTDINTAIKEQIRLMKDREKAKIITKKLAEAELKLEEKTFNLFQKTLVAIGMGGIAIGDYNRQVNNLKDEIKGYEQALEDLLNGQDKNIVKTDATTAAADRATAATQRQTKATKELNDSTDPEGGRRPRRGQTENDLEAESIDKVTEAEEERQKAMQETVRLAQASRPGIIDRWETEEERLDRIIEKIGKILQYYNLVNTAVVEGANIAKQAIDVRASNEIAALEEKRKAGLIGEKQFQRELSKIQNDAARKRRKAEIAQAVAMIPQAILSAFTQTTGGLVVKSIAAALAGAFAIAQVGILAKSPLPQFRGGVIDLQGPGTATSDSITARLSKGESVMTARETHEHRPVLEAIRAKEFEKQYVPIADIASFINRKIAPSYYPVAGDKLRSQDRNYERVVRELQDIKTEMQFNNQYTKQGNNIAAGSSQTLRDIKTVKRGIYT